MDVAAEHGAALVGHVEAVMLRQPPSERVGRVPMGR
jgi:hypothetical protein